ncbi:uncharacterized protein VTP21DRAFT_6727 [Calcarisporiella thermophila]|uniref:uncharacterized protein n=1 Tax=Calcarisporiella thermophila TaxID=911321 RepID=UPI003742C7E5
MKAYLQILTPSPSSPGNHSTPSVLVHFDSQRYLFNCGEGTQRLCVEKKLRLAKVCNIFLTRVEWECVGGIPGMLLTLADAGTKGINLHGGKNLTHFMAATRHFVYRSSMKLQTQEFGLDSPGNGYKDENLRITPVILLPSNWKEIPKQEAEKFSCGQKRQLEEEEKGDGMQNFEDANAFKRQILSNMFAGGKRAAISTEACSAEQAFAKLPAQNSAHNDDPASAADAIEEVTAEDMLKQPAVSSLKGENTTKSGGGVDGIRRVTRRLPRTSQYPAAISYICQSPDYPGKFNPKAAQALGLKPGPLYGKLQKGEPVTTPDGTVIEPHQVVGPSRPGTVFIVADCPDTSYIPSFITSDLFSPYYSQTACVIHLLGDHVLQNPDYQAWMMRFAPQTQHIIASNQVSSQRMIFESHAISQLKLAMLNEEIFPLPYHSNKAEQEIDEFPNLPKNCIPATNLLQFQIEPLPLISTEEQGKPFDVKKAQQTMGSELGEYISTVERMKNTLGHAQITRETENEKINRGEYVVTTLGTGSALPSKYRNVSSTLLEINGFGSILLDSGEGTYNQLWRLHGPANFDSTLKSLRCIFISHLHADHHLGIIPLLKRWNTLHSSLGDEEKIFVVAPWRYRIWLEEYADVQNFGFEKVQFVDCEDLLYWRGDDDERWLRGQAQLKPLLQSLELGRIETVDVEHCRWAYGLCLEYNSINNGSQWKFVYSGDTRPSENLIEAGKDATLLLHEATLEDEMVQEALAKRHSTVSEAIDVARRMNAKNVLLTHFSQRYPKIPVIDTTSGNGKGANESGKNDRLKVGIAFDMMRVRENDFDQLPMFMEPLKVLYGSDPEDE